METLPREELHPYVLRWWRNVPNAISLARIGAAPFLLGAVLAEHGRYFRWLLLACLLSDIVDGWIARTFHLRSRLGASLDSVADLLVQIIGVAGLWVFHKETVVAHRALLLIVVTLYLAEVLIALLRYGRISSFHTVLVRIAAYAQGIFIISLLFCGYVGWIFYGAMGLCILAFSEELLILYLLAEWTTDVGGLYWVLAKRRSAP
jgi:CDP-diacylglycerol--glycerol-3-phosphate 3-phosphatidyltransferase